jgi:protease IV
MSENWQGNTGPIYTPPPVPPPPPPPRKRSLWWLWVLIGLFVLVLIMTPFLVLVGVMASAMGTSGGISSVGEGVAIIRVSGEIVGGRTPGGFGSGGSVGAESLVDQIQKAAKDDDARAILLRINSPGGSAAGSEEVYESLIALRGKKPIVVSMGDVAASGGYYIASAADEIYCDGGTMTGSIGVITTHLEASGLLKKIGVGMENVTSGQYKDMGSPTRPLTAQERQLLHNMIMDIYNQFVDAVAQGRKMPRSKVLKIADGRVFSGRQAKVNGLVDEIGGFQDALLRAGTLGHLKGTPRKIEYGPKNVFEEIFGQESAGDEYSNIARKMLMQQAAKELAGEMLK